jgi:hypothetical protein
MTFDEAPDCGFMETSGVLRDERCCSVLLLDKQALHLLIFQKSLTVRSLQDIGGFRSGSGFGGSQPELGYFSGSLLNIKSLNTTYVIQSF